MPSRKSEISSSTNHVTRAAFFVSGSGPADECRLLRAPGWERGGRGGRGLLLFLGFKHRKLVGGFQHQFYDFPYIGNNNSNWRTHIFQRGWNHQPEKIDLSWGVPWMIPRTAGWFKKWKIHQWMTGVPRWLRKPPYAGTWSWPKLAIFHLFSG